MRISRNLRIGIIIKINYNNCFYVVKNTAEVLKIIIRYNIKFGWFKKNIVARTALLIIIFTFSVNYIILANILKVLKLFENLGNTIITLFAVFHVLKISKSVILVDKIITILVSVF